MLFQLMKWGASLADILRRRSETHMRNVRPHISFGTGEIGKHYADIDLAIFYDRSLHAVSSIDLTSPTEWRVSFYSKKINRNIGLWN
jgi:hypothetical protein